MPIAAIRSGNFHQLINSLGSISGGSLFRIHTELIPRRAFDIRQCLHHSSGVEGKENGTQRKKVSFQLEDGTVPLSTPKVTYQKELYKFKAVHCENIEESFFKKSIGCPATIIVFDIETTGFSPRTARIIELALRDLSGGRGSTFQTLVNPEKNVFNARVHGIKSSMVRRPDVPRFKELAPILLQYVKSRRVDDGPIVLVAHNGRRFDVPFVKSEFERCSLEIPADWIFVDTLPLARRLVMPDGSKLPSSSLDSLREHYKIPLVGPSHRAMQDVSTLCYVLQRITHDLKLTIPMLMEGGFRAMDV